MRTLTAQEARNLAKKVAADFLMRMARRLAFRRFLRAASRGDLDKLMRLQVLEGAAGQIGSWSRGSARSGMSKAREWFADSGHRVNPSWFQESGTEMLSLIEGILKQNLRRYKVYSTTPDDLIQNALAGLGANFNPLPSGDKFSGTGNAFKSKILSGGETPTSIAAAAAKVITQQIIDISRSAEHRRTETVGEDPRQGIKEMSEDTALGFLTNLMMDRSDPLGKRVRDKMRGSAGGGRREQVINHMMDYAEKNGRLPSSLQSEAKTLGMAPQDLSRAWKQGQERAFEAIKRDRGLSDAIDEALDKAGLGGSWGASQKKRLPRWVQGSDQGWMAIPF